MNKSIFLKSVAVGIAILLIPSIAIMQWFSHSHPVYRQSLEWLQHSPQAARYLGEGIESDCWVSLRSSRHTLTANVEYGIGGSAGQGEALVSAKKVGDDWRLTYIWYRPEGGRIVPLLDRRKEQR